MNNGFPLRLDSRLHGDAICLFKQSTPGPQLGSPSWNGWYEWRMQSERHNSFVSLFPPHQKHIPLCLKSQPVFKRVRQDGLCRTQSWKYNWVYCSRGESQEMESDGCSSTKMVLRRRPCPLASPSFPLLCCFILVWEKQREGETSVEVED